MNITSVGYETFMRVRKIGKRKQVTPMMCKLVRSDCSVAVVIFKVRKGGLCGLVDVLVGIG